MSSHVLKRRIVLSLLSAIAFIIMYLEFPLPLFPTFLTFDFSEVPALIGALTFGPVYGIMVELLKNLLHYIIKGSLTGVPIGELSNFVAGSLFVYLSTSFYIRKKTISSLLLGLCIGTITMTIVMTAANYFFIMPAYVWFLGYKLDDLIGMAQATNAKITDLTTFVLYAIAPYNIVKGVVLGIVLVPFYQRLRRQLEQSFSLK